MLRSRSDLPFGLIILATCSVLLGIGATACGDSSSSEKSPGEKPAPTSGTKPKSKALPNSNGPTGNDSPVPVTTPGLVGIPVVSGSVSGSVKVSHILGDGHIECMSSTRSVSAAGCKIVKPELAPQQEQPKRFRVKSSFGCNSSSMYLALSAGNGRMILPITQGKFDAVFTEELVLEGLGPLMVVVPDPKTLERSMFYKDKCFLELTLMSIEDAN